MNILKTRQKKIYNPAQSRPNTPSKQGRINRGSLLFQFWDFWSADIKQKFRLSQLLTNLMPCIVTILYLGIQLIVLANPSLARHGEGLYATNQNTYPAMFNNNIHAVFLQILSVSIFFIIMQRVFLVTKYSERIDENRVAYIRFNRSVVGFVRLINDTLMVVVINTLIFLLMIIVFYIYPLIPSGYRNIANATSLNLNLTSRDIEAIFIMIFCSGVVNFFIMYNTYFMISVIYYRFPKFSLRTIQGAGSIIALIFSGICIIMIYFVSNHYKIGTFFEHHSALFLILPPFNIAFSGVFLYIKTRWYILVLVPALLVALYYLATYKYVSHSIKRYLLLV